MKMSEPVGNSVYGPMFVRVTLGAYFILAGLMKLDNINAFVEQVQQFKLLPEQIAVVYGILLPYFEIGVGALLVLGAWTTLAAGLATVMLVSFIIALGVFPNTDSLFNKDVILLGAALSLLYTGSGALSLDRFRRAG